MTFLELKVPPPIVAALVAALMYASTSFAEGWLHLMILPASIAHPFAFLLVVVGIVFDLSGLWAFHRHKTTVNPLSPRKTTALVTSGIYQLTRNPMYVGLAFLLMGWSAYLSAWPLLFGPLLFVLYITRFQIQPEERLLEQRFGQHFSDYCRRVSRWL